MSKSLSPAAQAISDAFWKPGTHVGLNYRLVMALRAVTKNCVPDGSEGHWVYIPHLLAIIAEIEKNYVENNYE